MKQTNKYAVIGGQYDSHHYGDTPTLIGARRLANRNMGYLDNRQGWYTPAIYYIEDTKLVTNDQGNTVRVVNWDGPVRITLASSCKR